MNGGKCKTMGIHIEEETLDTTFAGDQILLEEYENDVSYIAKKLK